MKVAKHNCTPTTSFDRMVDDFFKVGFEHMLGGDNLNVAPAVNIIENTNEFALELAAPGFKKENFEVDVADGVLKIVAKKAAPKSEETEGEKVEVKRKYRRREFSNAGFERSFKMPKTVDLSKIDAAYDEGILTITLPKKEEAKVELKKIITVN